MATFIHHQDRKTIFFTDHALDRWWERCDANVVHGRKQAMDLLRERLKSAEWTRELPSWSRVSVYNQARAEGFLHLSNATGFVVNRNDPDLVAVTYLEADPSKL